MSTIPSTAAVVACVRGEAALCMWGSNQYGQLARQGEDSSVPVQSKVTQANPKHTLIVIYCICIYIYAHSKTIEGLALAALSPVLALYIQLLCMYVCMYVYTYI